MSVTVSMLRAMVMIAVPVLVHAPRDSGPQPPQAHQQDERVRHDLDVADLAHRAEQADRGGELERARQQERRQRVGEGDPATGEDTLDPGARARAVEEVSHDHGLAVARSQCVNDAIAEADGDEGPQSERARTGLHVPQRRGENLVDASLVLGGVTGQLCDAVAEHQRSAEGDQQDDSQPQERRAQSGGFHGSWHVTTSAKMG